MEEDKTRYLLNLIFTTTMTMRTTRRWRIKQLFEEQRAQKGVDEEDCSVGQNGIVRHVKCPSRSKRKKQVEANPGDRRADG